MNPFKAVSAATTRRGYWFDWETNRKNKCRSRRKARHVLNARARKEMLSEVSDLRRYVHSRMPE